MHAALDVHYDEANRRGTAAAVVFEQWTDAVAAAEYKTICSEIEPYAPGEFYRRELPCLLQVTALSREPIDSIVVDGYVTLAGPDQAERPGLGARLLEALPLKVPIVGVAKTRFHSASAVEVTRGESTAPLFVTSTDADVRAAAENIRRMHGPYRVPTLLKLVDRLSRS